MTSPRRSRPAGLSTSRPAPHAPAAVGAWVNGTTEAHFVALTAARHELWPAAAGTWRRAACGRPVTIFAGRDAHRSLFAAHYPPGMQRDHPDRHRPRGMAAIQPPWPRGSPPSQSPQSSARRAVRSTPGADPFEPTRRHPAARGWLHLDLARGRRRGSLPAGVPPRDQLATAGPPTGTKMLQTPYAWRAGAHRYRRPTGPR